MPESINLALYGNVTPFKNGLMATYGWMDADDADDIELVCRHFLALKALWPVKLNGHDPKLMVEGLALDRAEDKAIALQYEIFPLTSTDTDIGTLEQFEKVYGTYDKYSSLNDRRNAVAAKMVAPSGLNREYFYSVAAKLGYNTFPDTTAPYIQIKKGLFKPFRVGISKVGIDKLYDQESGSSGVTWVVEGTNVETNTILQEIFELNQPGNGEVVFQNA